MYMENEAEKACNAWKYKLDEAAKRFSTHNDSDVFLVAAQESLEQEQSQALLDALQASENRELLGFVGWDLTKLVFQVMTDDCVNPVKSSNHMSLLNIICGSCTPREICLSLSELLSHEMSWQKLVILLRLFKLTCSRLEGKIGKILSSILYSLLRCLRNRKDLIEEQAEILENTLEFVNVLVEKVPISLLDKPDDVTLLKEALLLFLTALLEHPLSFLEFRAGHKVPEFSEQVERNNRIAEGVVGFLGTLENGCLKRLFDYGIHHENKIQKLDTKVDDDGGDYDDSGDNDDGGSDGDVTGNGLSFVGLGCLSFLTNVAGIGTQFVPVVTTGRYALDINMVYINTMLCNNKVAVISKGLSLLLAVLNMTDANTLDHSCIGNKELSKLLVNLRNFMVHCEDSVIRQESVNGFRKIVSSFTPRGKYTLLRSLHQSDIQSGFAELLILILKEEIAESLQEDGEDTWFLGNNVGSFLLEDVFKVPVKTLQSEFGVIEESNRILSTLNLLRYLLIRDNENKTTIHTIFPKLEEPYLKKLTFVVELSKARIGKLVEEKQDEIKRGGPVQTKPPNETVLNVTTADGSELHHGSLEEQLDVLKSACLTVDIIESVLARIREISTDKRSKNI